MLLTMIARFSICLGLAYLMNRTLCELHQVYCSGPKGVQCHVFWMSIVLTNKYIGDYNVLQLATGSMFSSTSGSQLY